MLNPQTARITIDEQIRVANIDTASEMKGHGWLTPYSRIVIECEVFCLGEVTFEAEATSMAFADKFRMEQ